MRQQRDAAGGLDLVDDPHRPGVLPGIPVADGLKGHGSTLWELGQEGTNGSRGVANTRAPHQVPLLIQDGEKRKVLVGIATNRII